jgi:hypothetical protein
MEEVTDEVTVHSVRDLSIRREFARQTQLSGRKAIS